MSPQPWYAVYLLRGSEAVFLYGGFSPEAGSTPAQAASGDSWALRSLDGEARTLGAHDERFCVVRMDKLSYVLARYDDLSVHANGGPAAPGDALFVDTARMRPLLEAFISGLQS